MGEVQYFKKHLQEYLPVVGISLLDKDIKIVEQERVITQHEQIRVLLRTK